MVSAITPYSLRHATIGVHTKLTNTVSTLPPGVLTTESIRIRTPEPITAMMTTSILTGPTANISVHGTGSAAVLYL